MHISLFPTYFNYENIYNFNNCTVKFDKLILGAYAVMRGVVI